MNVVVTGGSGGLGREVVRGLRMRGATAKAASRRTGVNLATGEGLESALAGAELIVHAATHPTKYRAVDLEGTRKIIRVLGDRPDPPHLIYISIVGCDLNPYPYYRAKYACELVLERSGLPVTVVRATQFHTLVATIARACAHGPISVQPQRPFSPAIIAGSPGDWSTRRWARLLPATAGQPTSPDRSGRRWARR